MESIALLSNYLKERVYLLRIVTQLLENDPNVNAAWLIGSLGRGVGDALSDIDLWVVVNDDSIEEIIAQSKKYTSQINNPILFLEAPQNAPKGGAYLMTCYDAPIAPHIVDWYWQPQSQAYIPGQVRLLFDRAGLPYSDLPLHFSDQPAKKEILERPNHFISFFWMMLMIVAKQTYRSQWAEEMRFLPYLIDPIVKAQRLIGQNRIPLPTELLNHRKLNEKIHLFYKLADLMSEIMAIISEQGEEVPLSVISGAYRFLDMIDLMLEKKEE